MGFRYIGSKRRIITEIIKKIKKISGKNSHIVDLMCGTGAVSASLREEGFTITAVDVMTYAYHHTRVQLLLDSPPSFEKVMPFIKDSRIQQTTLDQVSKYLKVIDYLNTIEPVKGYFWKEFGPDGTPKNSNRPRKYFTSENASKIDGVRLFVNRLKEKKAFNDIEYSLIIHDLIMAVNDVGNIAGTYGHHLSKFIGRAEFPIKFKPTKFNKKGHTNHIVLQGYAEDLSKNLSCDLCYIDPPYLKRQYAANYHILETLARADEPEAIGVSGLRPWRDQYSNFCSKLKIRSSFKKIFENMDCNNFLISYSEDGLLTKDELLTLFSKFGEVEFDCFLNKRFKSNGNHSDKNINEYLFHLKLK